MKNKVLKNIIKFAIDKEIDAVRFYADLQIKTNSLQVKNFIKQLEDMEKNHINILNKIFNDSSINFDNESDSNIILTDYIVEDIESDRFQEILKIAIKREEKAFNLYSILAEKYLDEKLKNTFLKLAKEEANHKTLLENIYYNEILKEK